MALSSIALFPKGRAMLHTLLLSIASWFKSEEKTVATDIQDKDWASPHTLLLLALVGYVLWVSHMVLTADNLALLVKVFMVYLPCHALMFGVTRVCQAWGPNCRTRPASASTATPAPAPAPAPPTPAAPVTTH
jgi:hypothetical protein